MPPESAEFEPDKVRAWIEATEREVSELDAAAETIQQRLAQARKRLMLYHEILATITKAPVAVSAEELRIGRSVRERTIAAAQEILHDLGRPMRIQDIHAEFIRRGKPLPGRGTPTNIIAHLVTSPAFEKHGRGIYGLKEWAMSTPPEAIDDTVMKSAPSRETGA